MRVTRKIFVAIPSLVAITLLLISSGRSQVQDPSEYQSYASSVEQRDAASRIISLEFFLDTHPTTSVRDDAEHLLLWSYLASGNWGKAQPLAQRIGSRDQNDAAALAVLAQGAFPRAGSSSAAAGISQVQDLANRGLQTVQSLYRPRLVSDDEYVQAKRAVKASLESSLGFAAVAMKNYPAAQEHLRAAVDASPRPRFDQVYGLAMAYLKATPPNYTDGLGALAKAVALCEDKAQADTITSYGRVLYTQAYGAEEGWDQLVAANIAARSAAETGAQHGSSATSASTPPSGSTYSWRPRRSPKRVDQVPSPVAGQVNVDVHGQGYAIYFGSGKSSIDARFQAMLQEIARVLTDNPKWKITVEGHADGSERDAQNLSAARAEAVKELLVRQFGIATGRISTIGSGADDADGAPDARANNRRVDVFRSSAGAM